MATLVRNLLLSIITVSAAHAGAEEPLLLSELIDKAGFSRRDVERIGNTTIAREMPVKDKSRNVAFAGLIRLKTDGAGLTAGVERVDLVNSRLKAHEFGRFEDPAVAADVADLTFTADDLEVLADCEVSRCKFKLSKQGIDELASIDWEKESAGQEFTKFFRREAIAYVDDYRRRGRPALLLYEDKSHPLDLGQALADLLANFEVVNRFAPQFTAYLLDFPKGGQARFTDSFIWSVMDFGYRPTLAIDQIVVDHAPEQAGIEALVAAKTIYANHYLAANVQIGILVDGPTAFGVDGHYIVLIDRITFDDSLGGFKRKLLSRGLSSNVENRLEFFRDIADGR
jgi:hypothetical protein